MNTRKQYQETLKAYRVKLGHTSFQELTAEILMDKGLNSTNIALKKAIDLCETTITSDKLFFWSRYVDLRMNEAIQAGYRMCYLPNYELGNPGAEFREDREYASCDLSDKPTNNYDVKTLQMILREHQKVSPEHFKVIIPKYLGEQGLANNDLVALNKAFDASYAMSLEKAKQQVEKTKRSEPVKATFTYINGQMYKEPNSEERERPMTPLCTTEAEYHMSLYPLERPLSLNTTTITKSSCPLGLDCPGNGDCDPCHARCQLSKDPQIAWYDGWKAKEAYLTDKERRQRYGHAYADAWNKGFYARDMARQA